MKNVIRVALSGYNALTDTNIDHYSLYSDSDNVLIKEKARGSGSVDLWNVGEITHSLTYLPFYLAYTQVSSGRYKISNAYDPIGIGWRVYTDTSKLYFMNYYSSTYKGYRYYIFYDKMN